GLEAKACTLLRCYPNPRIVIAGDSRCLYHIRPDILTEITGKSAINIALEFCDLVTTVNCLEKNPCLRSADFLLVSASVYQINDDIIDFGYFSAASFFQTTLPEHGKLFWNHLPELFERYRTAKALYIRTIYKNGLFTCNGKNYLPPQSIAGRGYRGIDRVWDNVIGEGNYNWYRGYRDGGAKQRIFEKALNTLENSGPAIVVLISPLSPAWKHAPGARGAMDIERKFIDFYGRALHRPTSRVVSFLSAPDTEFPDSLFMDPLHLNVTGAKKLSRILADSLSGMTGVSRK
ncbi:MAG TPA: hypothetical protein VF335_10205, partial [Chitinivibrionales bacterium]